MINRQLYVTKFDKNFDPKKIKKEDYFLGNWCFNLAMIKNFLIFILIV